MIYLRSPFWLLFVFVSIGFPSGVSAQQRVAFAANFQANNQVIELDIPASLEGQIFFILWDVGGKEYNRLTLARKGTHSYDMRQHPNWSGTIAAVATTLPAVPSRVKKPTASDEIDMLFEGKLIKPGAVNGIDGYTAFGWSWNAFLFVVFVIVAASLAVGRGESVTKSVMLGFVVAWSVMDLRTILDHSLSVRAIEKYRVGMFPIAEMKLFADHASDIIGSGTWGHGELDDLGQSFLLYRLAERQYVAKGSNRTPDFWITRDPNEGTVLLKSDHYFLVKKAQP